MDTSPHWIVRPDLERIGPFRGPAGATAFNQVYALDGEVTDVDDGSSAIKPSVWFDELIASRCVCTPAE